jgi:hypothetical protein
VGASGEAIRLWVNDGTTETVFATEKQPGGASFPKSHTKQAYSARALITTKWGTVDHELPFMAATFPQVQTLPGDDLLVVASRCQRFKDGTHEMNARVYSADGSIECEFCLGDGIEHLQADSEGRIWVGYFDEGIFGNNGWGSSGGAAPLGSAGLVCYDRRGNKVWAYDAPSGFDSMADCYALNVAKDGVWTCYYTEFPIVRIDSRFHGRGWGTTLRGARELAVSGDSVLVYGGYREHRTDCKLIRLGDREAEEVAEVQLHLPVEVKLQESTVIGRDGLLHVFAEDHWFMFTPER